MKRKLLPVIAMLLVAVLAGCAAPTADSNNSENDPKSARQGASQPAGEKTTKTSEQVKQIAFDHAKVKEADVKDLEVELDKDNGTLHFDISFDAGDYDYEYKIDAYSGKILHSEKEKDD